MKKKLKDPLFLPELYRRHQIGNFAFVSMNIGYDGKVYFLFSSRIPPRIDGMFVDTVADAEYKAIAVTPSWENGTVTEEERIDFGRHRMNFHFLQPLPDGTFLLLGARCRYSEKNGPEKNAVFIDKNGTVLKEMTFGDGIADCAVLNSGTIVTSYFDEGIFGNYGWEDPIGSCGICARKPDGEIFWRSDRDICDCYAMNTDAEGNLWYYYYTDFVLVRTDFLTETEYEPDVRGADTFAVTGNGRYLIMDNGYDNRRQYSVCRIDEGTVKDRERLELIRDDGSAIPEAIVRFCGNRAIVLTGGGYAHFTEFCL